MSNKLIKQHGRSVDGNGNGNWEWEWEWDEPPLRGRVSPIRKAMITPDDLVASATISAGGAFAAQREKS